MKWNITRLKRDWGLNKYIRTVFIWSFWCYQHLFLLNGDLCALYVFILVCAQHDVFVCVRRHIRAYKSSVLFISSFFIFFWLLLFTRFILILDYLLWRCGSPCKLVCVGWLVSWLHRKIDYVRILHSHIRMQCNANLLRGASQVEYHPHLHFCCLFHILVLFNNAQSQKEFHSIPNIYECQSTTVHRICN